jgi:hypothetical protein
LAINNIGLQLLLAGPVVDDGSASALFSLELLNAGTDHGKIIGSAGSGHGSSGAHRHARLQHGKLWLTEQAKQLADASLLLHLDANRVANPYILMAGTAYRAEPR